MKKIYWIFPIALLLTACASQPEKSTQIEDRPGDPDGAVKERQESSASASPAVVALLGQAQGHGAAGDGQRAAASLERALRIEPENPWIWHRLAVLRLQQQRWSDAITLAKKSSAVAGDNDRIRAGNWELIARAEAGRGNDKAAAAARKKSLSQ